jgi:hypothetical protein
MASKPITHLEMVDIVPIIKSILEKQRTPMLSKDLESVAKRIIEFNNIDYKLSSDRLRIVINYLRRQMILPIISSSRGYHISSGEEESLDMAASLELRAKSILAAARGLRGIYQTNQP